MDGATLAATQTYPGYDLPLPMSRYNQLVSGANEALQRAGCTTVRRAAAFLAQVGAESGSLRWSEELADGSAYEWRSDLGNNQPGDGPRFKGRTFIQITGRSHYGNLGRWAHQHGYAPSDDYFLNHPSELASDRYVWLGPVWYWTVARPQINSFADAGDIDAVTYAVNGGYNNASGRRARWGKCLSLGNAILPTKPPPPAPPKPPEGNEPMPIIVTVDQKDCQRRGKVWPGVFLLHGRQYTHISTPAELIAYQHRGYQSQTCNYDDHVSHVRSHDEVLRETR